MMSKLLLLVLVLMLMLCSSSKICLGKECRNETPHLASHTFRANLLMQNNQTLNDEVFSNYHLSHTDQETWSGLLVKEDVDQRNWDNLYRDMKSAADGHGGNVLLKEVSLRDVRLSLDSYFWNAQQTNLQYLLMLDVDSLVWSFRQTAGLPTPGKPYGGWEAPNFEIRGHFVGHYLSATALMYASTDDEDLKAKMTAVVSALNECQKKIGTGYLSAFPTELFDRFEALKPVWAPYYTIHKIMAGLLDQYVYAGNAQALDMIKGMADYFNGRVMNVIQKFSLERHYFSLNEEVGGMNDILYQLYRITKDQKHLVLAHLFDKPCFLGLLAVQADDIADLHANTHIPLVVGAQMRYEITGEEVYKTIGTYFMDVVNSSHCYSTGGTSTHEFWRDPKRLATTLDSETEESCSTYNMLKVARNLFKWTKEVAYADYYERALTNGVLGIQRGVDPGVMIYMLPLGAGVSKSVSFHGWGTKFDTFWCCYGTGIESFSKLGDSIFFEEQGNALGLYIIQYIPSTINWQSGKIKVSQVVQPVVSTDPFLRVTITIQGTSPSASLNLRIPSWTNLNGANATINGQNLPLPPPGSFLTVTRVWNNGDKLNLQLPMTLRTETIKDDRPEYATLQSILFGPYLLVGHSRGDRDIKTGPAKSLSDWITPIPADQYNPFIVTFTQKNRDAISVLSNVNQTLVLEQQVPGLGTDIALRAAFRLILSDTAPGNAASFKDSIGKSVTLEPIAYPGMLVTRQLGPDNKLVFAGLPADPAATVFNLVKALNGNPDSVSLELKSQKGCYVSGTNAGVKLSCNQDPAIINEASFLMGPGVTKYFPISFVAKGAKQNFLLQPIFTFADEFYTAYFNVQV